MQRVTATTDHNDTHTQSVGLLWTRDRPVAETSWQHWTPIRQAFMPPPPAGFETLGNRKPVIVIFALGLLYTFSTRWHSTMNLALSRSTLTVYFFWHRHQAGQYLCWFPKCLQVTESFNDDDPSRLHEKVAFRNLRIMTWKMCDGRETQFWGRE